MSAPRRSFSLFLAATAIAAFIPLAASMGQPAQTDKVPGGVTPLHAPMPRLSAEEIVKRSARGGGQGGDYNISRRSDFDKALANPYVVNQAWYTMPKGRYLGGASAIEIDRDGRSLWVAERCGTGGACGDSHVDPIIHFNADGKILKMLGHDMIAYPHGMYIDRQDNIWVTDTESNNDASCTDCTVPGTGRGGSSANNKAHPGGGQVLKFSPQGKLLLRLGVPAVYGNDESHFSQPSDVVLDNEGNIYVADGHDSAPANNRIVKFDKTGKFIKAWMTCQPWQERQIDCSHSLYIDNEQRLIVANRGNNLIDIFDTDGKLLAEWANWGKSSGLYVDKNDILYSADSESGNGNGNSFEKGVHIGSARTGEVTAFIPDPLGNSTAWQPGGTLSPEGVTVDKDGRIYTSSVRPAGLMRWTITTNTPPIRLGGGGGGRGGRGGRGAAPAGGE